MDIKAALKARISAAVGASLADTKDGKPAVYWLARPQGDGLPAITLQTISGDRPQTYSGFQGWRDPRVQMDVWAGDYATANAIREAAIVALAPRETSNGIKFDAMGFEGEADTIERTETATIYRARIDLLVRHEPA